MGDYVILTDSSCDLTEELLRELGVSYVPLRFTLEGETYENWLDGRSMPIGTFYAQMRAGAAAKTSAINPSGWSAEIERHLREGKDVLIVAFSSGLSSTYHAATLAAEELSAEYPERKICVVDTLAASSGEGLLLYHAVQMQRAGATLDEVRAWLEENRLHMAHWFTVDDLHYLKRGGRISATTAVVGTVLGIKPVLHMDNEGHLVSVSKTRGRKASLNALVEHMEKSAIDPEEQTVFISHCDCLDEAEYVAAQVRARCHVREVRIFDVGPVIGAHSGPGTMALFFLARER